MFCALENLKKRATALSSLSFFSASVILTLEDFVSALLKSCPRSPFLLCFLPFGCARERARLANNTDALMKNPGAISRAAHTYIHTRCDSRDSFTLGH